MRKVVEIDPLEDERWDTFVEEHPFGWLCHLSGWKSVLDKSFTHMKGHYLAIEEDGVIQAGLPLYEVKSWIYGNRLVSIPFATLSDPLISSNEDMDILAEEAIRIMRSHRFSFIEIKAHSSDSLIESDVLSSQSYHKHHYLTLDKAPDDLFKRFDRSCIRQKISKACNGSLLLKECGSEEDLKTFHRLHTMTRRDRQGLPPKPFTFFKSLWDVLSPTQNISILLCEYESQPIAGVMLLKHGKRVSIEVSAYDKDFIKLNPVHFLFWHSIKNAYEEGYNILDFGSTPASNTGLMDFKKRWATTVSAIDKYYYPAKEQKECNENESFAHKMLQAASKRMPDNLFEGIGSFFYHHLG